MTLTREDLAGLVDGLAGLPYGGEPVDQRSHALQAGWFAARHGADDELLLAAVLHDIGRARAVQAEWPELPHELSGAEFARRHLGERAAWIIAQHVPAKRYLVATDTEYHDHLSPASVASLIVQGGPMTAEEVAEFAAHPNADEAVLVRRWDDDAKDPDGPVLETADVLAAYDRFLAAR
ncbi:HD domain-containing protein [Amycolatopsis sp. FDAARGOS 1241]|uniref:HD domain-containing protein n=1 Tax=Amycolatopsis sp. FDAARGOS 1241 TaxID=2778070 RepID=UPI0019526EB5|nr:HD domain-containing protein [Amycolatopsis sp. FDAARGOS 1241]QRP43510.1 HD domain-containing protein [Amycolatopsis sp. FDAARGOS 1241]